MQSPNSGYLTPTTSHVKPQVTNSNIHSYVLKNTFLEIVDLQSLENKCTARARSKSESHVREKPTSDGSGASEDEIWSDNSKNTTLPSFNCAESSDDSTPRCNPMSSPDRIVPSEWTQEETVHLLGGQLSQSVLGEDVSQPPGSWTSPFSWYDESYGEVLELPARHEVIESLQKLTDCVVEEQLRREDLQAHEATAQLYPFIPFDDEGNVTSLGSILHIEGICKPCAFFKKDRCHKKDLCVYCHFEHEASPKPKPVTSRKGKHNRVRKIMHTGYQTEKLDAGLRYSL